MQTPWEYRYAHRMQKMGSSVIRELLKYAEQPDIISFAGGLPAPEVFPLKEFREACNSVLEHAGPQALQYSTTEGYTPLREMIARHTARYAVEVTADNILITSGSQQALDFLGRLFINRGDYIVVESPTYLGALQAWNAYGAQYIPVRADENGMIVDELEAALAESRAVAANAIVRLRALDGETPEILRFTRSLAELPPGEIDAVHEQFATLAARAAFAGSLRAHRVEGGL